MLNLRHIVFLLLLTSLFSSCYKDEVISSETVDIISAERVYLNTIQGQVVDTLGDPISAARVKIKNLITFTDEDGHFEIIDVMIPSSGTFLSVIHPNYYNGGTRIYASAPITQTLEINLVPRGNSQNFTNAQGATLKVADLVEVTVSSNTFLSKDELYEGRVTLEVYSVNATQPSSYHKRLQVFETYQASAMDQKILKTNFSTMLYIAAFDENDNALTIANNKKINVKIPVNHAQVGQEIRLFEFNSSLGFWTDNEAVLLADQYYEIELSHLNWWGIGTQEDASETCITFTNVDEKDNHYFRLSSSTGQTVQSGKISYGSLTCFHLLANETIDVLILNPCQKEVFSTSFSTEASGETNLNIDVENGIPEKFIIEIEVVDCDFSTLMDTVTVYYRNEDKLDSLDKGVGTFEIQLDECFELGELEIIVAQQIGNIPYSFTEKVNINESQREYNIQVVACQDVMPEDGFLTINGITYSDVKARQNPQETLIIATKDNNEIVVGFDGFSTGTFPGRVISFQESIFCEGKVSISQYDNEGGYVIGTFEIPSSNDSGCETFIGEFKAKREN